MAGSEGDTSAVTSPSSTRTRSLSSVDSVPDESLIEDPPPLRRFQRDRRQSAWLRFGDYVHSNLQGFVRDDPDVTWL